ncbi:MAG: hypothetical protein GF405_04825 [Candidatus Eisenbacteria bacterium]|nr:hypothetical protein [Candidatus Eisenbacteria bacterium]
MLKRALFILLIGLLPAALTSCGEEPRETSVSRVLDNGLTIVTRENRATPVIALQAWVGDGALFEEPEEAGIAYLLAHTVFDETESYGEGEIRATIESLGGTMRTYSSHDFALFSIVVENRHLDSAVDVLYEGLTKPVFSDERLAEAGERFPKQPAPGGEGPIEEAYRLCMEHMLPDHPYGRDPAGTISTVAGITAEDLAERHVAHYVAENMVVVLVGDVDAAAAADAIESRFASLEKRPSPEPAAGSPEWPDEPVRVVRKSDYRRTFAALAFPGPGIGDPESVAMDVLTGVLWRGERSGLHKVLVEELGLASSVSVGWYTRRQQSPVYVWLELEPGAFDAAENAVLGAVSRLAADGVGQKEVDEVVEAVRASMLFIQETAEGQAHDIGYWTSIGHPGFDSEYMERLEQVTPEDVRDLAERHLRARNRAAAAIVPREED